jgi:SNF2 family DNA or RNA helicase
MVEHQLDTGRGASFAGMGMGKTAATLTSIDTLQLVGDIGPALVLAPLRVAQSTWPQEARKWDQLSGMGVVPIVGNQKQRQAALRRDAAVYTINYEQIPWLVDYLDGQWPFQMVVADESTKLKGFRLRKGGKRVAALSKVARRTHYWINLTGTPAPNGLIDLWGQTYFLDFGKRLGRTFTAFKHRWFEPDYSGYGTVPRSHAQDEIQQQLGDICLTIQPKDWFDLDAPIVNIVQVELPDKARRMYTEMEKRMFTMLSADDALEAVNAAAKTNKCRQLANGAAYTDDGGWIEVHDAKLQALGEIIAEASGAPILVAYQFVSDRERILRNFKRAQVLDDDPQTLVNWNAGRIPVLVAHPASAGHGLNMQDGGNVLVFFGLDWNLEEHDQMVERIGPVRQKQAGHDRPVFIHYIAATHTVDELIRVRLKTKREVQEILLEAMKHGTQHH